MKRCNLVCQRGVALVEMALLLPIAVSIIWLAIDLFKVNIARNKLEQSSYTLASTIAAQRELERVSVEEFIHSLTEKLVDFELYVAQVQSDRQADWMIQRSTKSGLCSAKFAENTYLGAIPSIAGREDDMPPVIVVQMCSGLSELKPLFNLLSNKAALESVSISRVMNGTVRLDESFDE